LKKDYLSLKLQSTEITEAQRLCRAEFQDRLEAQTDPIKVHSNTHKVYFIKQSLHETRVAFHELNRTMFHLIQKANTSDAVREAERQYLANVTAQLDLYQTQSLE
jgi:hypothetical protein